MFFPETIGERDPQHWIPIAVLVSVTILASCTSETDTDVAVDNTLFLLDLPPNRWVKYHEQKDGRWWRKGRAGVAYDSVRGSLLVFGSDTHGGDWDNVVHEFVPKLRQWVHHGTNADSTTYQVTSQGFPMAGNKMPWAMHTYDGVEFDRSSDVLVVAASPGHNPIKKKLSKAQFHPIWIYERRTKQWSIFDDRLGTAPPGFFGAATAYDEVDKSTYICKSGLWSSNLTANTLKKTGKAPNCLHRTMVFDSWRRDLYIFGDYKETCSFLRFNIGFYVDETSEWEKLTPSGDRCTPYSSVPVAFDEKNGVFLLVVNDTRDGGDKKKGKTARTLTYDPETNSYEELEDTTLPAIGMNFMMVWDEVHPVFFLLTGNWKNGIEVWVLSLAPRRKSQP